MKWLSLKKEILLCSILTQFDAVITGVRAYNVHDTWTTIYDLMEYVKQGGNLIVQYNTH